MIEKTKIMNTLKQKKISIKINRFLNNLFILEKNNNKFKNILITVIYVYISKNLNYSNIYITVYPNIYNKKILNFLNFKKNYYKKKISNFLKNNFKIPNINFLLLNNNILELIYLNKYHNL
ncbi:MAG: hypothetical protein RDO_0100 [Flavobacteriales endosymbiont of Rhyzopertha dominica]|nr:MAG: ribosome-binding factor A [Candidatus Shikimatogenerans bostrichidophilus]